MSISVQPDHSADRLDRLLSEHQQRRSALSHPIPWWLVIPAITGLGIAFALGVPQRIVEAIALPERQDEVVPLDEAKPSADRVALSPAALRFLPANQERPAIELLARVPVDLFQMKTPERSVEILADGTLWRVREPVSRHDVPSTLASLIENQDLSEEGSVDHLWLMAYELETTNPDGSSSESFVDPLGHELLRIIKPRDQPQRAGEASPEARARIDALRGTSPIISSSEESEWGETVTAASWDSQGGRVEAKVLTDGRVLYWEMPASEPIPEAISSQPSDAAPEALLLEAYGFTSTSGARVFHTTGREINIARGGGRR